jgi:type II secretory pathway component PulK
MIVKKTGRSSRGLTVVVVLVCLIIITLVSGAVLKIGLAQRELARAQERRLQAEWLAESGAQRALARLAVDSKYTGETWSVSTDDLGQSEKSAESAGNVAIAVDSVAADSGRLRVRITADYPRDPPRRARHTREFMIDLKQGQ